MPSLIDRKRNELEAKSAALNKEFTHWKDVSAAGRPFERHHSQIRRVAAHLSAVLTVIADERRRLKDDEVLTSAVQIEQKILAAHLIWEFFRSRLALRADTHLATYLRACDEFAWSCWKPFLDRSENRKEPPLVFLNGGWSPFAVSRDLAFKMDRPAFEVDQPAIAWLATGEFRQAIDKLPVPMIGVPWYQINHLPDALVLGHEMGHVVESDFKLTAAVDAAVAAAAIGETHRKAWRSWSRETFADIFGTLAGGPRFGHTMMDFLATDRDKVRGEQRSDIDWTRYPTRWMRIALVCETLRQTGLASDADHLQAIWRQEFGNPEHNTGFADDIPSIVSAILKGPYDVIAKDGNATLSGVLWFRTDANDAAMDVAVAQAVRGRGGATVGNAREYVAAARVLFEEVPAEYASNDYGEKICGYIEQHAPTGTRGTPPGDLDSVLKADAMLAAREGL